MIEVFTEAFDTIDTKESVLWEKYWREAETFWEEHKTLFNSYCPEKKIYLELLFDAPNASIPPLFIAKYLQIRTGAEIVAHVESIKSIAAHTARSFGVTNFIIISTEEIDKGRDVATQIYEKLPSDIEMLRRAILDLKINDIHVGDLVYDWYLRRTCYPTISDKDEMLIQVIADAETRIKFVKRICSENTIIAGIVTHRIYATYGSIVRTMVSGKIPIYARKPGGKRFTIRRYTKIQETYSHEMMVTPDEVADIPDSLLDVFALAGKKWIERRFAGKENFIEFVSFHEGYSSEKNVFDRQEMLSMLDLNPKAFTVVLLSHAFSDEVHSGSWQVHDDYYLWLIDCIEIAKTRSDINWLIKPHPDNPHYNLKDTELKLLKQIEKNSNIRIVPDSVSQISMINVSDAIATVRGTAGLEFATFGKTVILAGESIYSKWQFGHQPKTAEEFTTTLKNVDRLKPMSPEEIKRACISVAMRYIYIMVDCAFIVPCSFAFWDPTPNVEQLTGCLQNLQSFKIQDDPLYINFNRQITEERCHMCNFDITEEEIMSWVD